MGTARGCKHHVEEKWTVQVLCTHEKCNIPFPHQQQQISSLKMQTGTMQTPCMILTHEIQAPGKKCCLNGLGHISFFEIAVYLLEAPDDLKGSFLSMC